MITMAEIARLTHVSQPTVSRVLNGNPRVAPEIRERVLACAREHDYQLNALAKGLKGSPTHLLGVLVTDISNGFFADLTKQIEICARERGYSIILFNSDYNPANEREYLDVVRRYRVDGVLAVPIRETSPQWYQYVQRLDVPVATITRRSEGLASFYVDHADAGARVAAHLAERGYRRFLFVGKDYDSKFIGFRRWLAAHGLGADVTNRVLADHDAFCQWLTGWLARRPERAAVFAGNDVYALQVLDMLREAQIAVPQQVGVIGFDDTFMGRFLNPRLSTVRQPAARMAREAVTWLLDRIEQPGDEPPPQREFATELVPREST